MLSLIPLILSFFRPGAIDFADAGAGIFAGAENQYAAYNLPQANYYRPSYGSTADAAWVQALQAIQAATVSVACLGSSASIAF